MPRRKDWSIGKSDTWQKSMAVQYDVAIVGGGPGGTTVGTLLKKYVPQLRVLILERERFPRDHVGESQLPIVGKILDEMGVWDKVEEAGFLIKTGASYTWGRTKEPWVFGFIPDEEVKDDPRPAPYADWRKRVALQVDRAVYDNILLEHAQEMGCEVRQQTPVAKVVSTGDHVDRLELANGDSVRARYYIDASGNAGILRRAMGVAVDVPTLLKNVAFWDYFEKPGMNSDVMERGSSRVRIRSVPFGWVWYIALSEDRTSVGLVTPSTYFKERGATADSLFQEAIAIPDDLQGPLDGANSSGNLQRTTDWSFLAERAYGENWFLCGESLGFADPILAAGMALTHSCGRHLAYTIAELERGEHDADWLTGQYNELQRKRVIQHMKFAEYWYSGNGEFTAIQNHCREISNHAGLALTPEQAFRWLSNGGIDDDVGQVAIGGLSLAGIKGVQWRLQHDDDVAAVRYQIDGKSEFKLNLDGAQPTNVAALRAGRVVRVPALERNGQRLVLEGAFSVVHEALKQCSSANDVTKYLMRACPERFGQENARLALTECIQCLEMMVSQEWVVASTTPGQLTLSVRVPKEGKIIYREAKK